MRLIGKSGFIPALFILGMSMVSCQLFEKQERSTDENGFLTISHTLKRQKQGKSTLYFQDGKVRQVEHYKQGILIQHKRYYHSGRRREAWHFTYPEGKIMGPLKKWYKNGQLKEITTYENGLRQGPSHLYDTIGRVLSEGSFVADKEEGWWDTYSPNNGALIRHSYFRQGLEDTLMYSYYETGQPKSYLGRIPHSRLCYYWEKYPDGHLVQTGYYTYQNLTYPRQDSTWTYYDQKGNIKQFTNFRNGQRNGLERIYYSGGQLYTERTYKSDQTFERYNGRYRTWYENGQLSEESYYRNGKRDSSYTEWYPDGSLKTKNFYRNTQPHGLQLTWYENGQKQSEKKYLNGKPDSTHTLWYENGRLKERYEYKDSALQQYSSWDSSGIIHVLTDHRTKTTTYWDSLGRLERKEGPNWTLTYYTNGNREQENSYDGPTQTSTETMWWENGNLQSKWISNPDHSTMINYYPNGKKMAESYTDNKNPAKSRYRYWDEKGKLIKDPGTNTVFGVVAEPMPQDVLEYAEERASYPGGEEAFLQEVYKLLEYDMEEIEYEGKIEAKLRIDRSGAITNVEILSGGCLECITALRNVLRKMPHWEPAKINGMPQNSDVTLTFTFFIPE